MYRLNIVLFHGTWVDGSSWSKVIPILQNAGHKVIAVQLPLHSLADDVAPAWKQLPTRYQVSDNDRIIPPDVQSQFAKQMNATTISLLSNHASPLSHPNEIAQLILNATKGGPK